MPLFPNHLLVYPHTFYECGGGHDHYCPYCDGGLSSCTTCGACEGQLLVNCPGFRLSREALDACYKGNVVDLCGTRRYLRRIGDGRWVYRKPTEEEKDANTR